MASRAVVPLDKYLNSSYEPDREFVDGVLVERNVGTLRHSVLQNIVQLYLGQFQRSHGIQVCPDARLRVERGRHRIPDVLVLEKPFKKGKVDTDVPVITVEIKSPDDKFDDIVDKCFEYQALEVSNILVMDPDHRRTWLFERSGLQLLTGDSLSLKLTNGAVDFPFGQMFTELYED